MTDLEFKLFTDAVEKQYNVLEKSRELYEVDVNRESLYTFYLNAFPEGTNVVFKERLEYDCNTCKNFIRDVGNVVMIQDDKLVTVWDDLDVPGYYKIVADKMAEFVKSFKIKNIFSHFEKKVGCAVTHGEPDETGFVKEWNHFHAKIDNKYYKRTAGEVGLTRDKVHIFKRGLTEIRLSDVELVLEQSLERGEEKKDILLAFKKLKEEIDPNLDENQYNIFIWKNYMKFGAQIFKDVIGTLLKDLKDGEELDVAANKFESKMVGYKRPMTHKVTPLMIKKALEKIDSLGIRKSLYRRPAVISDVSVNNVLFVDRNVSPLMKDDLQESLLKEVKQKPVNLSKVEEISIDDFVNNVLPNIDSMEALFENKHASNLVQLIAPLHEDAPNILKWDNNFTWSYKGNVTDSIKERVKAAGGNIDAVLRFSIQWNDGDNNQNDFDAHCIEPNNHLIYYSNKGIKHESSGMLDIDIQNPGNSIAVENITWTNLNSMPDGKYEMIVHNFAHRGGKTGFTAQIEFNNIIYDFTYDKELNNDEKVKVATITKTGNILEIESHIQSNHTSTDTWNIKSEMFQKVNLLTISPNYWDDQKIGNKHFFFILENALNDEAPRGFYNEFLKSEFDKERKVFEMLGDKTKCEISDNQLSGLGFSTTKRNTLIVKVSGNFTRTLKIKF